MKSGMEKELTKTIAMGIAAVVILVIIGAGLAFGTDVSGITDTTISGTFTVGGECYYKGSIGCLPSGSVLLFTTACPTGWTRQTLFDSRYIRFSSTPGLTGGASTHSSHTFSHSHSESITSSSGGAAHSDHSLSTSGSSSGGATHAGCLACTPTTGTGGSPFGFTSTTAATSGGGAHTHTITGSLSSGGAAHTHTWSGTSASASPTDGVGSNSYLYATAIICKKD